MNIIILDDVTIENCKSVGRALFQIGGNTNLYDDNYSRFSEQIREHVKTYVDPTNWNRTINEWRKYEKAIRSGYREESLAN